MRRARSTITRLATSVLISVTLALSFGGVLEVAAGAVFPGDMFVTDVSSAGAEGAGALIHVDRLGTQTVVSAGSPNRQDFVPSGVAIDVDGHVIVGNVARTVGEILRIDPRTGTRTTVSSGGSLVFPSGVALAANGDILVADPLAHAIIRVNPLDGAQSIVFAGGGAFQPFGIAVEASGNILVTDNGGTNHAVARIDPLTGAHTLVSTVSATITLVGMDVGPNGDTFIAVVFRFGEDSGGLMRVDPVTGAQSIVSSGGFLEIPSDIAIDANGDILLLDEHAFNGVGGLQSSGGILRVNQLTGAQSVLSAGGKFGSPWGIAVVPGTIVEVQIDIKPDSVTNVLNVGSHGTVPVAILSGATFDATTVDPATVTLANAPVKLKGNGTPMVSFDDINRDGLVDMVVHIIMNALQVSRTDTEAVLTGRTFGGTTIRGTDSVRIVR